MRLADAGRPRRIPARLRLLLTVRRFPPASTCMSRPSAVASVHDDGKPNESRIGRSGTRARRPAARSRRPRPRRHPCRHGARHRVVHRPDDAAVRRSAARRGARAALGRQWRGTARRARPDRRFGGPPAEPALLREACGVFLDLYARHGRDRSRVYPGVREGVACPARARRRPRLHHQQAPRPGRRPARAPRTARRLRAGDRRRLASAPQARSAAAAPRLLRAPRGGRQLAVRRRLDQRRAGGPCGRNAHRVRELRLQPRTRHLGSRSRRGHRLDRGARRAVLRRTCNAGPARSKARERDERVLDCSVDPVGGFRPSRRRGGRGARRRRRPRSLRRDGQPLRPEPDDRPAGVQGASQPRRHRRHRRPPDGEAGRPHHSGLRGRRGPPGSPSTRRRPSTSTVRLRSCATTAASAGWC